MEDILEEIVGNILDEYDVDEHFIQKIGENTYIMKGLAELSDVEDILGIQFTEEFETLNGFVISRLEHIPSEEEHAEIVYKGYRFQVVSMADNIIGTVKVTRVENNGLPES